MKMKKIAITALICYSGLAFGQSAPEFQNAIKSNFSQQSIEVYQENSQNKLNEFYEYLTIYSTETDQDLKSQVKENIFSMVAPEIEIVDFTQEIPNEIGLAELLSKIENQNYTFQLKSHLKSSETAINHWTNSYKLSIIKGQKIKEIAVNHQIYFQPEEKQFGSKTKTVWEIRLGDIVL